MGAVRGTSFAVWAPRAKSVRVIGDFNDWDGRVHPMRSLGSSGVWELFIPDVGPGSIYKFEIRGADDVVRAKADPMARRTEAPPNTGSIIEDSTHEWRDDAWMARRARTDPHTGPMSVYEVHLGSWREGLGYRDLAEHLVNYVKRPRVHPRRAPPRHGAPVRPVVGVPGHRLLRPDRPVRHARTTSSSSSTPSTSTTSA